MVAIVEQPWIDRLRYELYHWYDMRVPLRIPGYERLLQFVRDHGAEMVRHVPVEWRATARTKRRLRDRVLEWDIEQDFRCYHLSQKNLVCLVDFEVDEVTYNKI